MRILLASLMLLVAPAVCFAQTEEDAEVTPTNRTPLTLEDEVRVLQEQVAALRELVNNLQTQLRDSAPDNVVGAMEKDPEVQRQVGHAVQGRLNILNFTGQPTEVSINGARWTALRGRSYVLVPVGQVAVFRTGDERAQVLPRVGETWERRRDTNQLELTYELY